MASGRVQPTPAAAAGPDPLPAHPTRTRWRTCPQEDVRQNQRPAPALTGHFPEHHAFLLGMMVDRVDALTAQIDTLAIRIEKAIAPFAAQVAELDEIPGIGITTAREILAATGTDMSRFPTPGHLVSWAKFAPKARQSAARSKAAAPARATPGSAAPSAKPRRRPNQHLPGRPLQAGRQAPRNKRALVAVGNSILIICWHLLSDPGAHFADLGPDWHDGAHPSGANASSSPNSKRLSGKRVTLNDAA
jgi:transposase